MPLLDPEDPLVQWLAVAARAEEVGFHGVALGDHASNPQVIKSEYPYSAGQGGKRKGKGKCLPNPFVMIGAMAAVTNRLWFTTTVLIAPLRDPILLAKEVATAARLAERRIDLGVGIGWMEDEFEALGIDFASRALRMEEMIPLMQALWRGEFVQSDSEHFRFRPNQVLPKLEEPISILVGGHSPPALKRAARMADGWVSAPCDISEMSRAANQIMKLRKSFGTDERPFELRMMLAERPDLATLVQLAEIGVTSVVLTPWLLSENPGDHRNFLDDMSRFGEVMAGWQPHWQAADG